MLKIIPLPSCNSPNWHKRVSSSIGFLSGAYRRDPHNMTLTVSSPLSRLRSYFANAVWGMIRTSIILYSHWLIDLAVSLIPGRLANRARLYRNLQVVDIWPVKCYSGAKFLPPLTHASMQIPIVPNFSI